MIRFISIFFVLMPLIFLNSYGYAETNSFEGNQSILGNDNVVRDVNVGDHVITVNNFGSINRVEPSSITSDEAIRKLNATNEAIGKLNALIQKRRISMDVLSPGTDISYKKEGQDYFMYIKSPFSPSIRKMNCYTGEISYIGRLYDQPSNHTPIPPNNTWGNNISNGY